MRTLAEVGKDLEAAKERRRKIKADMEQIHTAAGGDELRGGQAERFENLSRGLEKVEAEIDSFDGEYRAAVLEFARTHPQNTESGFSAPPQEALYETTAPRDRSRDPALRTIERHQDVLSSEAGDRLSALVERDRTGIDARYLSAIGDEHYSSAFGKIIEHGAMANLRMTREETTAVERVARSMAERAMTVGTGAEGGFAVPFDLDPTVILTSDGSVNPLRQLARIRTATTNEWRGVNSEGITAGYAAEAAEAGDDSPTLAQPIFAPQRAHAFVPFSIELGQDWGGLQSELAVLFADAKDQLEAEQFITGNGTAPNPEGLVAGLPAGSIVDTAAASTYAVGDVYALQEALPPRFQPRAAFLASNTIINATYRFVGTGDPDEPRLVNEDRSAMLGKPLSEVSTMSTSTDDGDVVLVFGDINRAYQITDRVGMSVELVPHLFGANRRPTGQRGVYAFWRNTAGILVANAVRGLRIKAA